MDTFCLEDLEITLERPGRRDFAPLSFPAGHGIASEIVFEDHVFEFDLNGAVKRIHGKGEGWPDPLARLKRTPAHDWVYYDPGAYDGLFALTGAYYMPVRKDGGNPMALVDPFEQPGIREALEAWRRLVARCGDVACDAADPRLGAFLRAVHENGDGSLGRRARALREILRGRIPVLPPEARLVDYEVIPVILAEGCLYRCRFCAVKAGVWAERSSADVAGQIEALRAFYGRDLVNHNAIFLGQNDALAAGEEAVLSAAILAWEELEPGRAYHEGSRLLLFGSPDALLAADEGFLRRLNQLPYEHVHVNVGLESLDDETLEGLGRPVRAETARMALLRAAELNRTPGPLEVSVNFVVGEGLSAEHVAGLEEAVLRLLPRAPKGAVYLSPLVGRVLHPGRMRREILDLKSRSRWPLYLYLIQPL